MSRKEKRFYSEAFKRQVVQEYERGTSAAELRRKYDIRGNSTLQRWIQRYGRRPYREGAVYVQTAADRQRLHQLEDRLSSLQKLVAELTLENRMLRASLEVREEEQARSGSKRVRPSGKQTKPGVKRGVETKAKKRERQKKGEEK